MKTRQNILNTLSALCFEVYIRCRQAVERMEAMQDNSIHRIQEDSQAPS